MVTNTSGKATEPTLNQHSAPANSGHRYRNRHSIRHGLSAGALPDGCGYIVRLTRSLRVALEDAVIAAHGEVSILHAAAIQSAVKWERHSLLALRWLRLKQEELTNSELLQFSREVARASTERDRCLDKLDLGAAVSNVLDGLYANPVALEADSDRD